MSAKKILTAVAIGVLGLLGLRSFKQDTPRKISVIDNFDLDRYLGTWYEIARMDFKFERNLVQVTANYSLRADGKVKVENRGYDTLDRKWKQSTGKAKLAGKPNEGRLKVSFFGPFYSPYHIVAIDESYRYVLVVGKSPRYMWLLSREKSMPEKQKQRFLEIVKGLGAKTEELIWGKQ